MAVDEQRQELQATKPRMRNFWPKYKKRVYAAIFVFQYALSLVIYGALQLYGVVQFDWIIYIAVVTLSSITLSLPMIAIVQLLLRPFRDLVHAVALSSNEPSAVTPPNPNDYSRSKDGFKEILQTVYEMQAHGDTPEQNIPAIDSYVAEGLNDTSTGLVMMDGDENIIYHNSSAPVREVSDDKSFLELHFPADDDLTDWLKHIKRDKLRAERQWIRVSNKLPGEENRKIYDIIASYHRDSTVETVLTLFDRTSSYMPEEEELDFISFAAHELRGPITVIHGYLDVLNDELNTTLAEDQKELMSRLIVSSNRLSSYINNILNASRYDRRHLKLHLTEETPQHIYDLISDDMKMRAETQNRLLVTDIPKDLPTVAADANAVSEVLSNLIDNGIKYSNEGGLVHVKARAIPGFVEISIIDRGIGMPESVVPNLFHKFYRSHRSRETVAGTGIGLYICKAIVSSHGGTITARSIENEGSTFSFTIPIYETVAEKIKSDNNSNESLIEHGSGWIRNHSLYRG